MASFADEYQKLNPQQRDAVDFLDGPVMVIAGAGTGKTQTIALRIGNILQKTDTSPGSILCLTYTDIAAQNMRSRLFKLIGSDAYKVKICTFHSFCLDIIASNPEFFPFSADSQTLDELERMEIIRHLLDRLDNSSPLISWGDRYTNQKKISDNIQIVKRENFTPAALEALVADQEIFYSSAATLIARLSEIRATKNNYSTLSSILNELLSAPYLSPALQLSLKFAIDSTLNLSEVKTKVKKIHQDLEKDIPRQKEFISIYRQYQQELSSRHRYDYEDMILHTLSALRENSSLLLSCQEKYQYILVDEYQDTNSSQNSLLDLLSSNQLRPNLFVVGDDDQSIYRFQGASVENIVKFYQQYQPHIVVLVNNYRSHRLILASSASVIANNKNRIAHYLNNIDKTLVATTDYDPDPINLASFESEIDQDYYVASQIAKLIKAGEDPAQIAVLFRYHKDAQSLLPMLSAFGIKYYLPSDTDILQNPHIISLIKLLEYIDDPTSSVSLFHLLSSPFVKFPPLDLIALLRHHVSLVDALFDPSSLDPHLLSPPAFRCLKKFALRLAKSRQELVGYPLDRYFNRLLRRFRILKYYLSSKDIATLNQIYVLSKFIKDKVDENNLDLTSLLARLKSHLEYKVAIPSPPLDFDSAMSVKLFTIHGAKGLEFNHVFMYSLTANSWEKHRDVQHLRLPYGILSTEASQNFQDDFEDNRRLFYVALTRAKKQLYLTHAGSPTLFISEIDPELIQDATFIDRPQALETFYDFSSRHSDINPNVRQYLSNYLSNSYRLSVSHLNSFLRCPLCFYYKTILRIPQDKDRAGSFGTAVHHALANLYHHHLPLSDILSIFEKKLISQHLPSADHQWCLDHGRQVITDYHCQYFSTLPPEIISEYNFDSHDISFDHIPLTGKIDLIVPQNSTQVDIYDFKTGNPDNKVKDLGKNGEYFRQLVFYKLLFDLNSDPQMRFRHGFIDFVEKSKKNNSFVRKEFDITPTDIDDMKKLITDVYRKIINMEFFEIGPECSDRSHLHYLGRK